MQLKDFQQTVLDTFDAYLEILVDKRRIAQASLSALQAANVTDPSVLGALANFPQSAWQEMARSGRLPAARAGKAYSPRSDGTGAPVPNTTLKIPTGGGKTLLAAAAVSRILNKYLEANSGFVLWIVPNEAIYSQTRKQLTDREHPYRQMLDRASAGRVKILDKESPLAKADVDSRLCVMLLMLPSANRVSKETLRLFRDRGNVHGFTPAADDGLAHEALLGAIPNLDAYPAVLGSVFPIVKDSLSNALRIVRPIIVMDEGHKAASELSSQTLLDFNPSILLELTATPRDGAERWANWLVDVRGSDLDSEDMIKLPINLTVIGGDDWKGCVRIAWEKLRTLQSAADTLRANSPRYIRPIMLVQVERVGKDQLDAGFIHSKHVIEYLKGLGVHESEIAEKTSEVNDLSNPENQDLFSPTNPIRVIVTKQALQEGWDCSFAYLLCSLATSSNLNAMTQLVGRILRQPSTQKTGLALLDECYVYCHKAQTADVVKGIKGLLERDGMADLSGKLVIDSAPMQARSITRQRRPAFANARLFVPQVLWVEGGSTPRILDWEQDILSNIDWSAADVSSIAKSLRPNLRRTETITTRIDIGIVDRDRAVPADFRTQIDQPTFDPVYATRTLFDVVPNAWLARDLVGQFLAALQLNGWSREQIGDECSYLVEELRKGLLLERDRLGEDVYKRELAAGRIQYRLRTGIGDYEIPHADTIELPDQPRQAVRTSDGAQFEMSLFAPVYEHEFDKLEHAVACYLDGEEAMKWWYRNVVRPSGYSLQGWRKNKVYPDFIFAVEVTGTGRRVVVLETKGDQLAGNLDTEYKRQLLELLSDEYQNISGKHLGSLEIDMGSDTTVVCDIIYQSSWEARLRELVS